MKFVIGIVLLALLIVVSVALHECGHMWVARATGMKVRRYFVGVTIVAAFTFTGLCRGSVCTAYAGRRTNGVHVPSGSASA